MAEESIERWDPKGSGFGGTCARSAAFPSAGLVPLLILLGSSQRISELNTMVDLACIGYSLAGCQPIEGLSMAKQSFIRAFPPFRFLAEHMVQEEGFLSDAKYILGIESQDFEVLARALAESDAFLDRNMVSKIVGEVLGAGEESDNLADVVCLLSRIVRDSEKPLVKTLTLLKSAIKEHSEDLTDDEREELGRRLEMLVAQSSGLARQHKAEQLADAIGKKLAAVQLICDIRPVFNEDRSGIEGALPVSTLKLDFFQEGGESSSLEVCLTEQQITNLCEKAESAKRKIELIKEMLAEKSIVLPATSATIEREGN